MRIDEKWALHRARLLSPETVAVINHKEAQRQGYVDQRAAARAARRASRYLRNQGPGMPPVHIQRKVALLQAVDVNKKENVK